MNNVMFGAKKNSIETRAMRRAAALFFGLSLVFWVVSALSRATENARIELATAWEVPWVLEGSSLLTSALLFFGVWKLESWWPISPGRPLQKLGAHLVGVIAFSAIHIASMVVIRKIYWAVILHSQYVFFRDPVQDLLYDFRKDVVTYITILMLIHLSRSLEIAQAERLEAQSDASERHRIVLKCGGRTTFVDANRIDAVQADGNYVFVYAGESRHHARMPLSDCLKLLTTAGQDVRRVHKSWLVNFAYISQTSKTSKGDIDFVLSSGRIIRGSRRYQDGLAG